MDTQNYEGLAKLRYYNRSANVFSAVSVADAVKVLRKAHPELYEMDVEKHLHLSHAFALRARAHDGAWRRLVNAAAQEAFGRPFRITDYKISGIASDAFSEHFKAALRRHAQEPWRCERLAAVHAAVARKLSR
jgi:hypothetical protein